MTVTPAGSLLVPNPLTPLPWCRGGLPPHPTPREQGPLGWSPGHAAGTSGWLTAAGLGLWLHFAPPNHPGDGEALGWGWHCSSCSAPPGVWGAGWARCRAPHPSCLPRSGAGVRLEARSDEGTGSACPRCPSSASSRCHPRSLPQKAPLREVTGLARPPRGAGDEGEADGANPQPPSCARHQQPPPQHPCSPTPSDAPRTARQPWSPGCPPAPRRHLPPPRKAWGACGKDEAGCFPRGEDAR